MKTWTVFALLTVQINLSAGELPDSTSHHLGEVEVSGHTRRSARIRPDGTVVIDMSMLGAAPRLFGEADLLRSLSSTAGVATVSDYSSGASVDGMDYSQNLYLLNGAPVQFPYHFGGIFSTFNSRHYPQLTMTRSAHPSGATDCLGAVISTSTSDTPIRRFHGAVNIGMLASSLSIAIPVTKRLALSASARASYIDLLYSGMIDTDDTDVSYNLHDIDFEARYNFRPYDDGAPTLKLFAHHNADRLRYDDTNFAMTTRLHWSNTAAGAQLTSEHVDATISYSSMTNHLDMSMPQFVIGVPSAVAQWSADASYRFKTTGIFDFEAGGAINHYSTEPQSITVDGYGANKIAPRQEINSLLTKLWMSATCHITTALSLTAGIDANSYFGSECFNTTDIDPRLTLRLHAGQADLTLHAGRYHQYLHQVGFSEIGMPSNFKIAATRSIRPQQSLNFVAGAGVPLPWWGLRVNADIYFKRVLGQPEYFGGVLDLLDNSYTAEAYISNTSGYSTGCNLTIARNFNALSVAATYSYALGRRRLPGSDNYFTASSDIRHTVNLSASYDFPDNHWSATATWTYASGRPVTPVEAVYFIGERVMVEYGPRNSARLPSYHRLDLGGAYSFTTGRLRHQINLSVVNAYGHRNIEISTYAFNTETGTLSRREISSLFKFLPSLNYTIEF